MKQDLSKTQKEIQTQANRLKSIEKEYLSQKDKVHETKLQLDTNVVDAEKELLKIQDQIKELAQRPTVASITSRIPTDTKGTTMTSSTAVNGRRHASCGWTTTRK